MKQNTLQPNEVTLLWFLKAMWTLAWSSGGQGVNNKFSSNVNLDKMVKC